MLPGIKKYNVAKIVPVFVAVFDGFFVSSQEIYCNAMKKLFGFISACAAMLLVASCEPAEWGEKFEYYLDDIYTVNKHAVVPEFSDTFIMVSNMDSYPFQTGDRARMILRYYYDSSTGKKPQYSIYYAGDKIPERPLDSIAAVDTVAYSTPFKHLEYYEFSDRYASPVWVWNGCQNINITYYGVKDSADFVMAVKGVDKEYLELELFAKAKRVNEALTTVFLTYDLSNVGDFLTAEQERAVASYDSLKTRIYLNREYKDENGKAVVEKINFVGGKLANPFKK